MSINFNEIKIGNEYDRKELSAMWGYASHQAISRGVITPANSNIIVFFVTKIKQDNQTQYNDIIDEGNLYWEGEEKHGSDYRIVNSTDNKDIIHLFYREIHHTSFVYYGQIRLDHYKIHKDKPSFFVFKLIEVK